jgi:phage tail-like protein
MRAASTQTALVESWLAELSQKPGPTTVTIAMLGQDGQPVARYSLQNAFPVKWSIAGDASASSIAIETLELSHERVSLGAPCSPSPR